MPQPAKRHPPTCAADADLVRLEVHDACCSVEVSARDENAQGSAQRNLASVSVSVVGGLAVLPEGFVGRCGRGELVAVGECGAS